MLIDTLLSDEKGAFLDALHHLILPTIVLGTMPLAVIARMTRSAMLEVLGEDYIRTARAKGLGVYRVVAIHALRNALIPVVTVIGLQVGTLMGGAILTESVFSWPGIGKWLVEVDRPPRLSGAAGRRAGDRGPGDGRSTCWSICSTACSTRASGTSGRSGTMTDTHSCRRRPSARTDLSRAGGLAVAEGQQGRDGGPRRHCRPGAGRGLAPT